VTDRAAQPDPVPAVMRVPCAGAIIKDETGRLLLILRGHEPGKGLWSVPGGRIEPGETDQQAVVREVLEETGLEVACGALLGAVERPGLAGAVIDIRDYAAVVTGGALAAGDDAADVRWVSAAEAEALDVDGQLTSGLLDALRSWNVIS
jgi:8-oxo-dGTP diphosphatase